MKAMAAPLDWRRWLTALCVLLVATLYLEPAHATDHAAAPHAAELISATVDGGAVHIHHADGLSGDHDSSPGHDGGEPHAHHCVGSHAACFSAEAGLRASTQNALDLEVRFSRAARISQLTIGLERPPRAVSPT